MNVLTQLKSAFRNKNIVQNVLLCLAVIIVMHLLYGVYRSSTILQEGARRRKSKTNNCSKKTLRKCNNRFKKNCKKLRKSNKRKWQKKCTVKTMKKCLTQYENGCNRKRRGGTAVVKPPADTHGCDGVPGSGKVNDACNVCGGDGSTCAGCDGVPGSGKVNDACNVCGGDGSTCKGCTADPDAVNYDKDATLPTYCLEKPDTTNPDYVFDFTNKVNPWEKIQALFENQEVGSYLIQVVENKKDDPYTRAMWFILYVKSGTTLDNKTSMLNKYWFVHNYMYPNKLYLNQIYIADLNQCVGGDCAKGLTQDTPSNKWYEENIGWGYPGWHGAVVPGVTITQDVTVLDAIKSLLSKLADATYNNHHPTNLNIKYIWDDMLIINKVKIVPSVRSIHPPVWNTYNVGKFPLEFKFNPMDRAHSP